jgi:SAM-dependent methyltransferase
VRRLSGATAEDLIDYNLRDDGHAFSIFEETQPERVHRARRMIASLGMIRPKIVELGCSTGDISGFFAHGCDVTGIDVTPGAVEVARIKWPGMTVIEANADDVDPFECDIIVLCEFLEHIVDPVELVKAWLPLARFSVIGHPVVGMGPDPEPGHVWAYDLDDYLAWYRYGGHVQLPYEMFPMGPYSMVMGTGMRA